ncbi:MAG: lysylphosphatidylglycerol synthase transmembrane domain-containing protein [bacterium]
MLAKGSMVFICISLAVMIGILFWTTDSETWDSFQKFNLYYIPILLTLATLKWVIDGMAFVSMAKHSAHCNLSLKRATLIRLESNFVGSVVPVLVGTVSMHAYLLHREKMRTGESIAITALRAILPIVIFLFNIPIFFVVKTGFSEDQFFTSLLKVVTIPILLIVAFILITLFYPRTIKSIASSAIRKWGKVKFFHVERILALEEKFFKEIDHFSKIFRLFLKKRKLTLGLAIFWILFSFIIEFFIAIAILKGFGFNPPIINCLAIQFLIRPIIYFAPSPGGAGFWEFTYLGVFSMYMPHHLIGISVLIWRILITYIPVIIGGIFLTREFRYDSKLKETMIEKGGIPDEELDYDNIENDK